MPRGRPRKVVSQTTEKDNLLDSMIVDEDESTLESIGDRPSISSPEWNKYVLSLLTDEEFDERVVGIKLPKTDGLVRIAKLLFGKVEGDADILFATPTFVVAKYTVYSDDGHFSAVADATPENSDAPYDKFLTGVASTRAKGRAYRDLLGLNNINVAEERSEKAEADVKVTSSQRSGMNKLCNQLNIDINKFINMDGDNYKTIDEISKNDAQRMMARLNDYVQKKEEIRIDILRRND